MAHSKKREIFDVAVGLIQKSGYDNVTVKDICEAADISNGSFFYHFKTKEDLLGMYLGEVYDEYLAGHMPPDDETGDFIAYITELSACYGRYCMRAGADFVAGYYSTKNANLDTHLFSADNTLNTTMAKTLEALVRACKDGLADDALDCTQGAIDCCTIIKGSVFEWCVSKGAIDLEASIGRTISRFLFGYATGDYIARFGRESLI